MSLGTTEVPVGETGTVTKVKPMPDQIPDNPGTLVANTSLEDINNILYRNWVWRNTYTIDSAMQPGTIFGSIKIHPRNCNDYITHITQMFKTWTGSMKLRTRFMATYQFGGSFRLGWLPPIFSQSDLQKIPIQTLTAYPNIDLDPKNMGWTEFQGAEERNILFHWMSGVESDDPQAFGGWYVFYVAAPLVVSGGTSSQISMLVEAAGSFNFSQLAPLQDIGPSANAWIQESELSTQIGCDDRTIVTTLQVLPSTVRSLGVGYFFGRGTGLTPTPDYRNVTISNALSLYLENVSDDITPSTAQYADFQKLTGNVVIMHDRQTLHCIAPNSENNSGLALTDPLNATKFSKFWYHIGGKTRLGVELGTSATATDALKRFALITNDGTDESRPININNCSIRVGKDDILDDDSRLVNTLDESILVFCNNHSRTYNIQTVEQGNTLFRQAQTNTMSQLYTLIDDGGTSIAYVRLHPSGYFTTTARNDIGVYPAAKLYLRYVQDLSLTAPMPAPSSTMRKQLRKMRIMPPNE